MALMEQRPEIKQQVMEIVRNAQTEQPTGKEQPTQEPKKEVMQ